MIDQGIINEGPTIASATSIVLSPAFRVFKVSGDTTIQTIVPPFPNFCGQVYLIPTDSSAPSIGTSGNVYIGATGAQNKPIILTYVPSLAHWCPSN